MFLGRDTVAREAEEVGDTGVDGQEKLGTWRRAEAALLPLLLAGRPMRLFNKVVLPCRRTDLFMLDHRQLGYVSQGGSVAPELVGHNPLRDILQAAE